MSRQSVVLSPAERCELGRGEYGAVCSHRGTNGKLYAVKIPIKGASTRELKREREMHFTFYNSLPYSMRKHFPKPVDVKWEGDGPRIDPSVYAMEEVEGGVTVVDILTDRKKYAKFNPELLLRQLRGVVMSMWKAGFIHGDLHLENMVVNNNGTIVVLDFGFMGRVAEKPPPTHNGDPEQRLDDKWVGWFKKEWKRRLRMLGIRSGNPNIVAWPRQMTMKYYAGFHKNIIVIPANAIRKGTKSKVPATKAKKTVAQLKASLRARALPVTGTKQVLQNRLNARIAANKLIPTPRYAPTPQKSKTPPQKRTVAQLKAELKKRGLPLGGLKKNLQNRLNANNAGGKPAPKKRTVLQLKASLRARALPVTGSKQVLQNRLNARIAANKLIPSYKV